MKKILLITASALLLCATSAFADMKIGVVDLNKILAGDQQVTNAQNQLKKQFDPRNQEIITLQKTLQGDIDKYNQDGSKLKGTEQKKEQEKIVSNQKKLQDMQSSFQKDVMEAQNKTMQTILKRVEGVVNKVAAEEKYDLIVTKVSTVFNDPKLEITDKIVAALKK